MIVKRLLVLAFALSALSAQAAPAQTPQDSPPPAASNQLLSGGELEALVAPIALYPDALLSEIFMASTYPLEVVEAERWVGKNKNLKGDQLKEALEKQSWDDSVKTLTATPDVLDMMSDKLDWTQKLGDAILAQQGDVMDAVQRLRKKAQTNNKLTSNRQQTVTTQQEDGKQAIVIAPTQPDTIYVPYYNPSVVYGGWSYPAYPPYYFGAPGYIAGGVIATVLPSAQVTRWGVGFPAAIAGAVALTGAVTTSISTAQSTSATSTLKATTGRTILRTGKACATVTPMSRRNSAEIATQAARKIGRISVAERVGGRRLAVVIAPMPAAATGHTSEMGPATMQPISALARVTGPLALAVVIARAAAMPWAISARADLRASIPHAAARASVAAAASPAVAAALEAVVALGAVGGIRMQG